MTVDTAAAAAASEQLAELAALVVGADGRRIARSALGKVGLPADSVRADDLLQNAWVRISRRIDRHGPIDARPDGSSGVVAYLTTTLRNLAHDQLTVWHAETSGPFDEPGGTLPEAVHHDVPALDERLDGARRRLQAALSSGHAWVGSAALVHVALAEDPARPVHPAAPRPNVDRPGTHDRWAALFYAGRDDCLPGPDGDDPADRRNRRTRAGATIDAALRAALDGAP